MRTVSHESYGVKWVENRGEIVRLYLRGWFALDFLSTLVHCWLSIPASSAQLCSPRTETLYPPVPCSSPHSEVLGPRPAAAAIPLRHRPALSQPAIRHLLASRFERDADERTAVSRAAPQSTAGDTLRTSREAAPAAPSVESTQAV